MVYTYSDKVIEDTIKYFLEENNLIISDETAIEYLDSMSGLFLAFADRKTSALTLNGAEVLSVCKLNEEKIKDVSRGCSNTPRTSHNATNI